MTDIGGARGRRSEDRRNPRPADQIEIRGLRVHGHHGVFEQEQRDGQAFVLDVVLDVDAQIAGRTDNLDDTIDYSTLVEQVAELVRSTRFSLIEALGAHVAEELMSVHRVTAARVTVTKPEVVFDEQLDAVAVTVHRVPQAVPAVGVASGLLVHPLWLPNRSAEFHHTCEEPVRPRHILIGRLESPSSGATAYLLHGSQPARIGVRTVGYTDRLAIRLQRHATRSG